MWSEAGYFYARCSACGGFFADLSEAEYAQARFNAWDEEHLSDATVAFYGDARARPHQQFLDRHPPVGNRRLLDVGCGLGYFLARAKDRGWQVSGIDTSPRWVELANQRLGGSQVQLSKVEQARFDPGSFALITAWDVVEHIFEPVSFLARMRSLLAPGGRLFIRTPNLTYVYPVYAARRHVLGHAVELGPTNHVVYFNARTMRNALACAGLRAISWPVHVPPQVAPAVDRDLAGSPSRPEVIAAKNSFARVAGSLARCSAGRVVLSSDLDVVCAV